MIYKFGDFELDQQLYELRRGGRGIKIEPKVFDVLVYLIGQRERVVSKDELLDRLWPGEFVSDSVLPRCIAAARKALGDDSANQKVIQTVHGRGYRFVATAAVRDEARTASAPRTAVDGTTDAVAVTDTAAAAPHAGGELAGGAESPFVGRDEAMQVLLRGLDDALASRGRLLLLVGEPGIGKTRTADEIAAAAERRGMRALAGRSYEGAGAPAFWPWTQILRACAAEQSTGDMASRLAASDAAQLVPELGDRFARGDGGAANGAAGAQAAGIGAAGAPAAGGGSQVGARESGAAATDATLPPEQARFRLFDSVTAFLRNAARTQALVLVLDDLHWADKPSLLLLHFLAREVRDARILIVGTYRDVELRRQHPLAELLGELAREPACSRIVLRGLTEADTARYLEATARGRVAPRVVRAVYDMTEGNPFFLGETVRLLVAERRLDRGEAALQGLTLPQGVREAIGRRLDSLSKDCNELLRIAAVIGREFALSVLERVTPYERDRLLELLDEAAAARIVARAQESLAGYAFAHALVRETLYEELSTPVRVRLHRQIAEALEASPAADAGARLAEIAHHAFQAAPGGGVEKAVRYCVRAAQRAAHLLAYEEAAGHYQRALEARELAPGSSAEHTELLLALGDAQSCSGERDKARATFEHAAALARADGRADLLARAALGFGGRGEMGMPGDEQLRALLEDALAALGDGEPSLRAMLLARMVGTAPYYESLETRTKLSAEALRLARAGGDAPTLIKALAARGWAMLGPDHVNDRLQTATELLALAERTGDKVSAFLGREYRQGAYLALGDMAAADREIAAAARLAEELRQPIYRWFATWWQASRALCDGRFDDAERLRHEALEIGQRVQMPGAFAIFAGQGLWLSYERGGTAEIFEPGFEFLLSYYPRATVPLRAGEALYYCLAGREAEARVLFDGLAADDFRDIARDEHWLSAMTGLAEVASMLRDSRRCAVLYEALSPFAERNCVHDLLRAYSGSVAHYLGLLAAAMGDLDGAVKQLEAALAMNVRLGAKPYVGRTQLEYARALLARGRDDDRVRARELLAECSALAKATGLQGLADKVRALESQG